MDVRQIAISKLMMIPAILIAFTFHEYAHAIIADKLGDKTPKFQGRLTLNPMSHVDIIGFISILIFNFGFAKPVQTNPSAYKNYYKDDFKVSIAGPIANLLVAFVFAIICGVVNKFAGNSSIEAIIYGLLAVTVQLNCMLFLFNLLPIPGFDGFHALRDLFPSTFERLPEQIYRWGLIIFFIIVIPIGNISIANIIIDKPTELLYRFFMGIGNLIH